jgi:hypothetical protein
MADGIFNFFYESDPYQKMTSVDLKIGLFKMDHTLQKRLRVKTKLNCNT